MLRHAYNEGCKAALSRFKIAMGTGVPGAPTPAIPPIGKAPSLTPMGGGSISPISPLGSGGPPAAPTLGAGGKPTL